MFSLKLILTSRKVSSLSKAFANNSSGNIKLSKSKICAILQSRRLYSKHPGPLIKVVLPLMINVIETLVNHLLIQVGLTATISTADVGILIKVSVRKQ